MFSKNGEYVDKKYIQSLESLEKKIEKCESKRLGLIDDSIESMTCDYIAVKERYIRVKENYKTLKMNLLYLTIKKYTKFWTISLMNGYDGTCLDIGCFTDKNKAKSFIPGSKYQDIRGNRYYHFFTLKEMELTLKDLDKLNEPVNMQEYYSHSDSEDEDDFYLQ
jgi:hypothetical protein